uniref:Uncharacterized protein n=1 Tax=Lepeophtheirus salmonis TaxID=72036 RepID=A0A0K2U257_LEPSM
MRPTTCFSVDMGLLCVSRRDLHSAFNLKFSSYNPKRILQQELSWLWSGFPSLQNDVSSLLRICNSFCTSLRNGISWASS